VRKISAKTRIGKILLVVVVVLAVAIVWVFWPERADVDGIAPEAATYDAIIRRDTYGVPHVWGATDADAAYGLAWAHAEDDFPTIQQTFLAARGKLASVMGPDAAPIDYFVHLLRLPETVDAGWAELPGDVRALCTGYADGLNHYAQEHPSEAMVGLFPLEGKDIVAAFTQKVPLFFGLDGVLGSLFSEEKPDLQAAVRPSVRYGSNVLAVSPRRSAEGETMLVSNSHQPWTGPVAWYEAHVTSDEGWDMTGALFPGMPMLALGHNRALAWSLTVNDPDLIDVYELEIDPNDPNRYRYDDEWRNLEVRTVDIEVRLVGRVRWTFDQEALWSVYGPVVRRPHGTYAIRYAGMGETGLVEQLFRMNKAATFEEWRAALGSQDGLPSFNIGYAGVDGTIALVYHGLIPDRNPGYDWTGYVDGDTSDTLWTGYVPLDDLPWVVDPSGGFVQNSNSTPFTATLAELDPSSFPPWMGVETQETNRSLRSRDLLSMDEDLTFEELAAIKWDMTYHPDSVVGKLAGRLPELIDGQDLAAAVHLVAEWDREADPDDPVTALMITTVAELLDQGVDLNASQMGEAEVTNAELRTAFAAAVASLQEHFGRIDPPWSEVNRLVRGDVDLGLGGGPDLLHAVYGELVDGRFEGVAGDGYVMQVAFLADGTIVSKSVHQFGSATLDEESPHFADQAPLFVERRLKPVWYDEADILANLEREYRPG
jgi:acyl-homoserine lactone acylase PvdQ